MPNDGMIDLGKSPRKMEAELSKPSDKPYYPTLRIDEAEGLYDLPDGEFTIIARVKKIASETREIDGKEKHSCTLEVHSIKPSEKKAKKVKEADERLDDSFDRIAKKKAGAYEDNDE